MKQDLRSSGESEGLYIDSHVHFWKLERGDYHWLKPSNEILFRNHMPPDLLELAASDRVEGFIAVQAAPTVAETEFLLELAGQNDRIIGVVGWLDPFANSFADEYGRLRRNPRFIGIRLDRTVFGEMASEQAERLVAHLRLLEEDGFPVDLLIGPDQMPTVLHFLGQTPLLKAVINHLGGPLIRDGVLHPWREHMEELSRFANMYCKWSGMITPAGGLNSHLIAPYIRHTAGLFGPDRLLFGSDWPVALMAGAYSDVVKLFEQLLPESWSNEERQRVRCRNAKDFYFSAKTLLG